MHWISFKATATLAVVLLGTSSNPPALPERLHDGLVKVSLTDFISGKYSLSYEGVIVTSAS